MIRQRRRQRAIVERLIPLAPADPGLVDIPRMKLLTVPGMLPLCSHVAHAASTGRNEIIYCKYITPRFSGAGSPVRAVLLPRAPARRQPRRAMLQRAQISPDRSCKDRRGVVASVCCSLLMRRPRPAGSPQALASPASPCAFMRENARPMRDYARADCGPNPPGR